MRVLLDTHVLLALLELGAVNLPSSMRNVLESEEIQLVVSSASLWEIAIKVRSKKLSIGMALTDLPDACQAALIATPAIEPHHVLAGADPEPMTRDPFDRLLIAQATCEGMRLVTLDRTLATHPRARRAPS